MNKLPTIITMLLVMFGSINYAKAQSYIHIPLYNADVSSCYDTIYVTALGNGGNSFTTAIPSSFPTSGADRYVTMIFAEVYDVDQLILNCNFDYLTTNTFLISNDISVNSPITLPFTTEVFEVTNATSTPIENKTAETMIAIVLSVIASLYLSQILVKAVRS